MAASECDCQRCVCCTAVRLDRPNRSAIPHRLPYLALTALLWHKYAKSSAEQSRAHSVLRNEKTGESRRRKGYCTQRAIIAHTFGGEGHPIACVCVVCEWSACTATDSDSDYAEEVFLMVCVSVPTLVSQQMKHKSISLWKKLRNASPLVVAVSAGSAGSTGDTSSASP